MSKPLTIGKVCKVGGFVAALFILGSTGTWAAGNEQNARYCLAGALATAVVALFFAMMVWLRDDKSIVTPLLSGPQGPTEAESMRGALPITADEVAQVAAFTDEQFMADLMAHVFKHGEII